MPGARPTMGWGSLRVRLLLLLLIVGLVPVLAFASYEVWRGRSESYSRAEVQLDARASDGVALLEGRLNEARTAVETLAAHPVLTDVQSSREAVEEQLVAVRRLYPAFEDLSLVSPSGRVVGSSDYSYEGTWGTKPWFREAALGRSSVSPPHLGGASLHLIVVFASPVRDSAGALRFIVTGQVPMSELASRLLSINVALDEGTDRGGGLYLLTSTGAVLAGPGNPEPLSQSPIEPRRIAWERTVRADGGLWHVHEVTPHGWWVAARLDEQSVLASTTRTLREVGLAAVISTVAVSILALLVSRRLSGVVSALSLAISRVGDGHLNERMTGVALEEFRSVVRSFNEMAVRLEASQAELRRSEEWFRSLVTYGSDVILSVTAGGEIRYVGASMDRIFGLQSRNLVGMQFLDMVTAQDIPRVRTALSEALGKPGVVVEHGLRGVAAARIIESHVTDLTDVPAVQGLVINMREVTERNALQADVERAIELDRLKTEFVGLASHELRTPLTGILGFSELMLEEADPASPEHARLKMIVSEAARLSRIIEDLLNVTRIEAGALEASCVPVQVAEVVEVAMRSAGALASADHHIVANVPREHWVSAERQKLIEVVENLVTNAIKYSPDGGLIEISSSAQADSVSLTVADHGLGIPESAIGTLFQRFRRIDSSDRAQIRGTGLGLYFVRRVVESFGGQVAVHSTLGVGSEFVVTVPSATPQASASERLVA